MHAFCVHHCQSLKSQLPRSWPRCSLMKFQCCHLKSGPSILWGTLASLLIVSYQCLHMLHQSVVAAAIYQLLQLRPLKRCMTDEAFKTLTHLSRLQSVQNAAARLAASVGSREDISPVLWQLQWLPVRQRVTARLQELHRPTCLTSVHSLRSADSRTCVPRRAHNGYGDRVLPLPVLVCGTVCRCSFDNRTFRLTVLKLYWKRFCFRWRGSQRSTTNRYLLTYSLHYLYVLSEQLIFKLYI